MIIQQQLMGGICVQKEQQSRQELMKGKLMRLKHQIEIKVQKQAKQSIRQEQLLLEQFNKQNFNRSKAMEDGIVEQIIRANNRIHMYTVVKHQTCRALEYTHFMNDDKKTSDLLFPSFRIILYSEAILGDTDISQVCQVIHKMYPKLAQAQDSMIESQTMKYHKKNHSIDRLMKNNYILHTCNQYELSLEKINAVGHGIRFGMS